MRELHPTTPCPLMDFSADRRGQDGSSRTQDHKASAWTVASTPKASLTIMSSKTSPGMISWRAFLAHAPAALAQHGAANLETA